MLVEHAGRTPKIHPSAYVAPGAIVSGDVAIGENTCVLFGAVITADGGPVTIGRSCVIMENAVVRGTRRHPTSLGDNVLVGPRAYLSGCIVGSNSFLATGATTFNGAVLAEGVEVRVNGVVHVNTRLEEGDIVPIAWVAVGNPAEILPPHEHARVWEIQKELDFPGTVFGFDREEVRTLMPRLMERYTRSLLRHREDSTVAQDAGPPKT